MPDHDTPCAYTLAVEHRLEALAAERGATEREIYSAMKAMEDKLLAMMEKLRDRVPPWVVWAATALGAVIGWAVPMAVSSLAH